MVKVNQPFTIPAKSVGEQATYLSVILSDIL
jgi:hypothetical protein